MPGFSSDNIRGAFTIDNAALDAVEKTIAAVSDWLAAGHAQPDTEEGLAQLLAIRAAIFDLRDALDAWAL